MKLCVPIRYKPEGGLYSFIANLTAYLDRHGVPYTQSLDDEFDALFVNSWVVPYETVARLKKQRPSLTVTQRVDGAAMDYGRGGEADREQARVNLAADATIFQSGYSRFSTREKFRVIAQDGPVIYNPVDLASFNPNGPAFELSSPPGRPRLVSVSFSTNRRKGTWRLDELAATHPSLEFVLCGHYEGIADRPNVTRLGHVDRPTLASILRASDIFIDLTENESCPNVVLEALASGLPVLHNASGAVPELVADAGVAFTASTFDEALTEVLDQRSVLSARARARAEAQFDPEVIFPRYLDTIRAATRHELPSASRILRLARQGYPVRPRPLAAARKWAGEIYRQSPSGVQAVVDRIRQPASATLATGTRRVGWITYDSFGRRKRSFADLESFTRMRAGAVATWMNGHDPSVHHELYDPRARYQAVVFQKMMDERCQREADRIRGYGGKVVFDANVNYYERWGDYFVPGTEPTDVQMRDAVRMTESADWVVADSSYLEGVIRKITPKVTWIPDNVDVTVYAGHREHERRRPIRLVWSGIGKKAAHLLLVRDVLAGLPDLQLVLVVDEPPPCLAELESAVRCEVVRFTDEVYAATLRTCDIIISPKRLANGYEMGHTEYKITLGMAVGLPAIASPQPSYLEAIGYAGGGVIADRDGEWAAALQSLAADRDARQAMGDAARRTVYDCYQTAVVARRYHDLLQQVVDGNTPSTDRSEGPVRASAITR